MTAPVTVDPDADRALTRAAELVRDVLDFPEPGILFRDITPVLADAEAFAAVATELAALVGDADVVAGIEARGFLLGAAVALVAGTGVVPLRKAGKLPAGRRVAAPTGWSTAPRTLELPADTVRPGTRVYVVDDVLATGGTAAAACDLLTGVGAEVIGFGALLGLAALGGRDRLGAVPVHLLLHA